MVTTFAAIALALVVGLVVGRYTAQRSVAVPPLPEVDYGQLGYNTCCYVLVDMGIPLHHTMLIAEIHAAANAALAANDSTLRLVHVNRDAV